MSGSSLFASRVIANAPTADESILSTTTPSPAPPVAPAPQRTHSPAPVAVAAQPSHAMLWGIIVGVVVTGAAAVVTVLAFLA